MVCKKTFRNSRMHIYAYNATELISEMVVGMNSEGTAYEPSQAIHPSSHLYQNFTFEALL
ncbi:MAG: hypothetical protein DF280_01940 ['Brassica napus' phytoplasma]|nr:MAG: hypothetical protein DF280_01940 ['Brassica napus' phytoplasma]